MIPVALVLKQDGDTVTGTISMLTQHIGQTVDVALKGELADGAFTLSGIGRRRQGSDDDRDQGQAERRRHARGPSHDDRHMGPHGDMPYTAERLKERK